MSQLIFKTLLMSFFFLRMLTFYVIELFGLGVYFHLQRLLFTFVMSQLTFKTFLVSFFVFGSFYVRVLSFLNALESLEPTQVARSVIVSNSGH